MNLYLVGLSHKTAPIKVREKLNFSEDQSGKYLEKLAKSQSVRSGMVLSTCNRVEIYAYGEEKNIDHELKHFICDFHSLSENEVTPYFYQKTDAEAVKHLFCVASSLDSIVVGEPQILGQVKDAYDISKRFGMIDSFFELFLQKTFSVAKKVRNETDIGKTAVSISSMAVELSGKIFENLRGKNALIVGSGEMAELALAHLKRKDIEKAWIANRTFETAAKLAKKFHAFPIYMDQFEEVLPQADIVIVATGMNGYLINQEMVTKSLEERKQKPQLYVDISVPRNIQPEVGSVTNAYLYNIDDLQSMVEENQQNRLEASKKATAIIEVETSGFIKELQHKSYSPAIQKLQNKITTLFENEFKKSKDTEKFKESFIQKLLASPIHFLKNEEDKSAEEKLILIEKIFDLDSDDQ